jgi:hypothetical protein
MSPSFINTANPAGSPKLTELRVPLQPSPVKAKAEFDQFSDLARKLVGVPKSEVDEQRKRD